MDDAMHRMLWLVVCLLLTPGMANGSKIETLLMPGPVIQGHAKYEAECTRCHKRLGKRSQTQLCLDCHEKVAEDVKGKSGYHGRNPGVRAAECKRCHTDHLGRDANIVPLAPESFDHGQTDFKLDGTHRVVSCERCHEPERMYREAPSKCHDCHREDDPHDGQLGDDCGSCHRADGWRKTAFDHSKTDFPLEGRHRKVACDSCHPAERYEDTPTECMACHQVNDVHGGSYGAGCDQCHATKKWDEVKFDHDRETDFPLHGRHAKIACRACHTGPLDKQKLETTCYGCHRADDEHHGRNGRACGDCHNETSWKKVRFDHDRTDFPLKGRHRKVACDSCHRGNVDEELETTCNACHRNDDVHQGQEGEACERCHNENGWGEKVLFDHDVTRFPLIGLHSAVPCEECHLSGAFHDAATECVHCHEADDDHKGALGANCRSCHNPNGWQYWHFDHDQQTDFVLDGAHRDLACSACHTRPAEDEVRQSTVCEACHKADDVHLGRFGQNCRRCHSTDSFEDVRIQE